MLDKELIQTPVSRRDRGGGTEERAQKIWDDHKHACIFFFFLK